MATTNRDNILVLGAGELGLEVLEALARHHSNVLLTVLLRAATVTSTDAGKSSQIARIKELGIAIIQGDLVQDSQQRLSEIFSPFTTIVSCTGFANVSGLQTKIAQAVINAKVPRYFPWQFGVDYDIIGRGSSQPLFDEQLDVRDMLRNNQHSTAWTIISTGMFTSFLFEETFGAVDLNHGIVRALGSWDTEVTVTTPQDIGNLTAEIVLSDESAFKNRVVYTAGDTISYGRLASVVEGVLGKSMRKELWTLGHLLDDLKNDPNDNIKRYRALFAAGKGVAWDKTTTYNVQKGIETEDVEAWLKTYAKGTGL